MSKKSKTKTEPWKKAQPHILAAQNTLNNTVAQQQPALNNIAGTIQGKLPGLAERAFSKSPMVEAAQGYAADTVGGKYLNAGNPHLEGMIAKTRGDVADQYNSLFSRAGRTGSSHHAESLGKGLAEAELGLRYGDYEEERARMAQAAGLAPGLAAAEYVGIEPYLAAAGTSAEIPFIGARTLAQGTAGLLGPYTQTTQKQGLGTTLLNAAVAAGSAYLGNPAAFSDERLKEDVEKVGENEDGLNVYSFRYKGDDQPQIGVMAQEVEKKQPDALGPTIGGFKTVDYSKIAPPVLGSKHLARGSRRHAGRA